MNYREENNSFDSTKARVDSLELAQYDRPAHHTRDTDVTLSSAQEEFES